VVEGEKGGRGVGVGGKCDLNGSKEKVTNQDNLKAALEDILLLPTALTGED